MNASARVRASARECGTPRDCARVRAGVRWCALVCASARKMCASARECVRDVCECARNVYECARGPNPKIGAVNITDELRTRLRLLFSVLGAYLRCQSASHARVQRRGYPSHRVLTSSVKHAMLTTPIFGFGHVGTESKKKIAFFFFL